VIVETIGAAKFKEQCLALLDRLDADGLVVTKHGKPVAKVIPYGQRDADLIGSMRGLIKVNGDIFTTDIDWESGGQP
jgi:prevent-host-death family protein